jgi:hypothetical protein
MPSAAFSAMVLNITTGNGSYVMAAGAVHPAPFSFPTVSAQRWRTTLRVVRTFALAFDLSKNLIVLVSVPNSNVNFPL